MGVRRDMGLVGSVVSLVAGRAVDVDRASASQVGNRRERPELTCSALESDLAVDTHIRTLSYLIDITIHSIMQFSIIFYMYIHV